MMASSDQFTMQAEALQKSKEDIRKPRRKHWLLFGRAKDFMSTSTGNILA